MANRLAQETSPANGATLRGTGFAGASTPSAVVIRAGSLDAATPVAFGDGLHCVGTPVVRLAGAIAASGGSTHTFGHSAMAGPGSYYYQLWYRSQPATFCTPAAFNARATVRGLARTKIWPTASRPTSSSNPSAT